MGTPKNIKKTVEIRKGKTRGMGYLSWARLEQRLRQFGELTDQQDLHTVYMNSDGLYYTTKKGKTTSDESKDQ